MWLLVPPPQLTNSRQHQCSCSRQGWTHRGNMLLFNLPARQWALCDEWHCWHQGWQFLMWWPVAAMLCSCCHMRRHVRPFWPVFFLNFNHPCQWGWLLSPSFKSLRVGKSLRIFISSRIHKHLDQPPEIFCVWFIDVTIPEVPQQMAPFPTLLLKMSARVKCQEGMEEMDERDAYFTVVCVFLPPTHTSLAVLPKRIWNNLMLNCCAHNVK